MANTNLARTIIGVIGNIISFGLFLSPLPTFMRIYKAKSVQEFKPDIYLATIVNCLMWVFYGSPLVTQNNILVLTTNAIGFAIEVFYILIFFVYAPWSKRRRILFILLIEAVYCVVLVFCILHFVPTLNQRKLIIGVICIVFNILMYFSPLTIMRLVIKTKSVRYMPFLISLANFANGLIWVIYALFKFDINLVLPNGLGALSGLAQLILYGIYYRTTDWGDENSQIAMSNV
ncbi:bidirectional sugar transporter SWEET5-like [Neltuma alba]|uniref:bidirectional sugar transporter SWEET5-like n=1 Tax=Neltuma alba TaxID=207710 RepID=UPI0010A31A6C|nr:bidirectional sugar transporter SWEET5-like [Prosopis alba]XP_028790888.1 bidirectional sugar transporter SWEET5-like [Prosopis alba]